LAAGESGITAAAETELEMPKNHARKNDLSHLKTSYGVKHTDAIALLEHDVDERERLCQYLAEYIDITTYKDAVDYLRQEQADPRNQLLCETCGWTNGMVCPECPGCGCYNDQCSGWRHHEYAHDDEDDDPYGTGCRECGAGTNGDPYAECCCYEDDETQEQVPEVPPVPGPEARELVMPGGWGSSSGPFPGSGWRS
jgi:hypothetical protein